MPSEWDKQAQELEREKALLARLDELEFHAKAAAEMGPTATLAENFLTLARAYRRKWHEAHDLKDYLSGLRDHFRECWDEEEEIFDPSYANNSTSRTEWCPMLIEEIGEMIDDGNVYVPHRLPEKPQES